MLRAVDRMAESLNVAAAGVDRAPSLFGRTNALRALATNVDPGFASLRDVRNTQDLEGPVRDALDGALVHVQRVSDALARGSRGGARAAIVDAKSAVFDLGALVRGEQIGAGGRPYAFPTREAATARAATLLAPGYTSMARDEWRELCAIVNLDDVRRPIGLESGPRTEFMNLASGLRKMVEAYKASQSIHVEWPGFVVLDRFAARQRYSTPDAVARRIEVLSTIKPAAMPREHLHEIAGMLQLPDTVRPTWFKEGRYAGPAAFAKAAENRHHGDPVNWSWEGFQYLAEWGEQARIDTAIAATGSAGEWIASQLARVGTDPMARDAIARVAVLRPGLLPDTLAPLERLRMLALATEHATPQIVRTNASPRRWLLDLQDTLPKLEINDSRLADIRERMLATIDVNLPRMEARSGNAFTNLAEVGAIGADATILARFMGHRDPAVPVRASADSLIW